MNYEDKYNELVELSKSDNPTVKKLADDWIISIGFQGACSGACRMAQPKTLNAKMTFWKRHYCKPTFH